MINLLPVSLPLLPQLVHVCALVYVVQVEVRFFLRLRHFGPEPLLQDRLLIGQPFAQVSPLEPMQVLRRQTGRKTDTETGEL